jgi:hypothetical protein
MTSRKHVARSAFSPYRGTEIGPVGAAATCARSAADITSTSAAVTLFLFALGACGRVCYRRIFLQCKTKRPGGGSGPGRGVLRLGATVRRGSGLT